MGLRSRRARRLALVAVAVGVGCAAFSAPATAKTSVKFTTLDGFAAPGTPDNLNKVGILKTGSKKAKNVLVLNPGTSASAAYFEPLAKTIVKKAKSWQVWAVERRENFLEDQSVFDQAKEGTVTPQQMFDYYLGYITDPSITNHTQNVPDSSVPFARDWGMNVEIHDLRAVVKEASKKGRNVAMGGHSLGGSITTAYATWDFNGKPGAKGLSALIYIDGGSSPTPVTVDAANASLASLASGSPWLAFGGIPAPFAGLFNTVGSTGTHLDPTGVGALQTWPLLPANLKPPVLATNEGSYGYALDTETSPASLAAAQAHLGHLAASGDPRPWDNAGELTPIQRFVDMFSGTGLKGLDGTAWYHPRRLTIDSGAVGDGNANPAQSVLDVHSTHGADLSRKLQIYAFGAALGGQNVLTAAQTLASQSGIPSKNLTLINRQTTYAHNDPNSAAPKNDFVNNLIPLLKDVRK